jgi:hypothetical protein
VTELLIGLLLLVCLIALALCLLTLWRRVKALGAGIATAGEAAAQLSASVEGVRGPNPPPCPTCGAPASAADPTAVRPVRA